MSYRYFAFLLATVSIFHSQCNQPKITLTSAKTTPPKSIKKIPLFRDTSWRVYSTFYSETSIYTCLPRLYKDKVTFLEEQVTGNNYFVKLFGGIIPPTWNINTGRTTVWNLDPFDSLDLAMQAANPDIVKSVLEILPISRASAPEGYSTDWRDKTFKTGKFDITQKLTLAFESLNSRINKYRATKGLSMAAGILSYLGLTKNTLFSDKGRQLGQEGFVFPEAFSVQSDSQEVSSSSTNAQEADHTTLKSIAISLTGASILISQHLENQYIQNHVKMYELLLNSDQITYNKDLLRTQLQKLNKKIRRFGFHKKCGARLQVLIEKI